MMLSALFFTSVLTVGALHVPPAYRPVVFTELMSPQEVAAGKRLSTLEGEAFARAYQEHAEAIVRARERARVISPAPELAVK